MSDTLVYVGPLLRRFGFGTMLIATTLIAVVLGIIVYVASQTH